MSDLQELEHSLGGPNAVGANLAAGGAPAVCALSALTARPGWRRLVACLAAALLVATLAFLSQPAFPVATQTQVEPLAPIAEHYVVQPGDSLESIATRHGLTERAIARANAIQNPRRIYPGQVLVLPSASGGAGIVRGLGWGEDLLTVSRAAGMVPQDLALRNGLLRPTGLPVGVSVWLPAYLPVSILPEGGVVSASWHAAPRVGGAVAAGVGLWDILRLNPVPLSTAQPLLLPDASSSPVVRRASSIAGSPLPSPITSLVVSEQPVARGETVVVTVETAQPVGCTVTYLDQEEACVGDADPGRRWSGFAGLPPLMTPGVVTLTLTLNTETGEVSVPVPVTVAAGRYDYERIDLPPDRQSLLDPALSQWERDIIAEMRRRRSPERYWQYPFLRPVDAAITSYYGSRRSYGYGFGSTHAGSDFDGQGGEAVVAPADGVVILAEKLVVRGNAILVDHGWGVVSGFWHLSEIAVAVGDRVSQGQTVGKLGNTGLSTGAHLHWELWVNGTSVNALSWLEPDGPGAVTDTP